MTTPPTDSTDGEQPAVEDPLVGTKLEGRYRLDALLAEGATGRVYLATQTSIDRQVAVKILHRNLRQKPELRRRFAREARVISGFSHPNIVRMIDFGQDDDHRVTFLVLELVDGTELGGLLERGRLKVPAAVEIAHQVGSALVQAHDEDIVHRDLKSENLILVPVADGDFHTKVLDFGLAFQDEDAPRLTNADEMRGTPAYMAPEQATARDVDHRADLYALGVLMFEMLTGQLPYHAETALDMVRKHADAPIPDLTGMFDSCEDTRLPPSLADLVTDLLAKTPDARPPDARTVRRRLETVREQAELPAPKLDESLERNRRFDPWLRTRLPAPSRQRQSTRAGMGAGTPPGSSPRPEETSSPPIAETHPESPFPTQNSGDEKPTAAADAAGDDAPGQTQIDGAGFGGSQRNWKLVGAAVGTAAIVGLALAFGMGGSDPESDAPSERANGAAPSQKAAAPAAPDAPDQEPTPTSGEAGESAGAAARDLAPKDEQRDAEKAERGRDEQGGQKAPAGNGGETNRKPAVQRQETTKDDRQPPSEPPDAPQKPPSASEKAESQAPAAAQNETTGTSEEPAGNAGPAPGDDGNSDDEATAESRPAPKEKEDDAKAPAGNAENKELEKLMEWSGNE